MSKRQEARDDGRAVVVAEALAADLNKLDALAHAVVEHLDGIDHADANAERRLSELMGALADAAEDARDRAADALVRLYASR